MLAGKNFVFTHNPKAAGTSVRRALEPYGEDVNKFHAPLWPNSGYQGKMYRICVVRNPWDRLVSAYHYTHKHHPKDTWPEFEEWLRSPEPARFNNFDIKRQLQLMWTHQCNRVLQFEHLEYQFNHLMKEVGLDVTLPHKNKSDGRKPYQEYYRPFTVDIVRDRFGPDTETWGYKFD